MWKSQHQKFLAENSLKEKGRVHLKRRIAYWNSLVSISFKHCLSKFFKFFLERTYKRIITCPTNSRSNSWNSPNSKIWLYIYLIFSNQHLRNFDDRVSNRNLKDLKYLRQEILEFFPSKKLAICVSIWRAKFRSLFWVLAVGQVGIVALLTSLSTVLVGRLFFYVCFN